MSYLSDDWPINPGNLGLTLTYSSSLVIWFQWGIRQTAEAENLVGFNIFGLLSPILFKLFNPIFFFFR